MDSERTTGEVKELVRDALTQIAPDELPRFETTWTAYLKSTRDRDRVLRLGHVPLGDGLEIRPQSVALILITVTGEVIAALKKAPATGPAGFPGRPRRRREARRAALTGAAPELENLSYPAIRATFLDAASRAGCPAEQAAEIADVLARTFVPSRT
jgi:hypothetical protein